jgi:hypothetical protein
MLYFAGTYIRLLNRGRLRQLVIRLVCINFRKKNKDLWPTVLPRPGFVAAVLGH